MEKIVVRKPADAEVKTCKAWPIWTCEVSKFPWHYDDMETCLILAGKVTVTGGGQSVSFAAGDLVIFPQGLDCTWDVKEPVRKHYKFG